MSNAELIALLSNMTSATGKIKKSGETRTASDSVKVHVVWPHEVIFAENGQKITSDNVTLPQFVRGMITLTESAPHADKHYMLIYLRECMLDCERFGWEHVRQFNKTFFHGMEQAKYTWKDTCKIDFERLLFKPHYPPYDGEYDHGYD